jgi:molybdenum cofactor synthesis domain-containing protein
MARDTVTAALILIGDEILSGRTKDKNMGYIADKLTDLAIELREVRVVSDIESDIVEAINALRARYDYVFTTGGIGPTHDDITADSVARAFGVGIDHHPDALAMLHERYGKDEINEARMRMARIPDGGELIPNDVSWAPGFKVENVYVMAGVPKIMQSMLDVVAPTLDQGKPMLSETVPAHVGEGDLAAGLAAVQDDYPDVAIGSYPFEEGGRYGANIVLRSKDADRLSSARTAVEVIVENAASSRTAKAWS